jgi:hypothetical protein
MIALRLAMALRGCSWPTRVSTLTTALLLVSLVAPPALTIQRPTIRQRQAEIRQVLEGFGGPLSGDELSLGPRGRRDLVLFSPRPRETVITALKQAYSDQRILARGYRVAGWASIIATDSFTFTFKDGTQASWIVEVSDAGVGARIVIWGLGRDILPERRPLAHLPMRLLDPP